MFGGNFRGEHLVNAARGLKNHPLSGGNDFDPLGECRRLPHHIAGYVENDGGLLPVTGAGINLGAPLIIVAQHIQGNSRAKLRFPLFFWYFDICGSVLPLAGIIVPHRAKYITDDLFLPGKKDERSAMEFAFGVFQALYELNDPLRFRFT